MQERTLRSPAVPSAYLTTWQTHLRMLTLYIRRAGLRSQQWKREPTCTAEGDSEGIKALEKELLAQNAEHKDWCCTEELMKTTKDGKALYLHCLPADINDVSCEDGEVEGFCI